MKYNNYLADSPKVSEIGLGAWQLGESKAWHSMDKNQAVALVKESIELGINFFDTAPNYGLGSSEERLGVALSRVDRHSIVINTKFGHTVEGTTNYTPEYIRQSIEGSLKRLRTDYVDSLIIHNPPKEILDGTKNSHYEVLEELVKEGKIKAYGASLDTYDEMKLFMETTNGKVIEAFFNILHQDAAKAFEQATQNRVSIIAKIPLDSGWLSGKYTADTVFDDIRKRWSGAEKQLRFELVEKVKEILKNHKLAQAAIAFCTSYNAITTVIPGCKSIDQLRENIKSADVCLTSREISELESFYQQEVEALKLNW